VAIGMITDESIYPTTSKITTTTVGSSDRKVSLIDSARGKDKTWREVPQAVVET